MSEHQIKFYQTGTFTVGNPVFFSPIKEAGRPISKDTTP